MSYYSKKQFIARVNKNDQIIGKVEKWKAHKEAILHRGFTMILIYNNQLVLQHRKHPVFNRVWDMSFSSHQVFSPLLSSRVSPTKGGGSRGISLQTDLEAIYEALKREWNVDKKSGLKRQPKFLGKIYYRAKDPESQYSEHEIDYIYLAEIKNSPTPNEEFAYGFKLASKDEIFNSCLAGSLRCQAGRRTQFSTLNFPLAPWVKKIVKIGLLNN